MEATTVRFDDQTGLAPEEVSLHLDAFDNERAIHLRQRQPGSPAKCQEPTLELPTRKLVTWIVQGDRQPKPSNSSATAAATDHLLQSAEIKYPLHFRLSYCVLQFASADHAGKVEKCPREARAWNPIDTRPIRGPQRVISMRIDPGGNPASAA